MGSFFCEDWNKMQLVVLCCVAVVVVCGSVVGIPFVLINTWVVMVLVWLVWNEVPAAAEFRQGRWAKVDRASVASEELGWVQPRSRSLTSLHLYSTLTQRHQLKKTTTTTIREKNARQRQTQLKTPIFIGPNTTSHTSVHFGPSTDQTTPLKIAPKYNTSNF